MLTKSANKTSTSLTEIAQRYLENLCINIPNRHTGSQGNQMATDYFEKVVSEFGFKIEKMSFDCMEWECGNVRLIMEGEPFDAYVSPYSLSCDVKARLIEVSTVEELEKKVIKDKLLLIHGELASEQMMPKNVTFYNSPSHQHIINILETKKPIAIISATGNKPDLIGGLYPFPMFEDGDFNIPSAYMTDVEGDRLLGYAGQTALLNFRSHRIPATGCNVIARKGLNKEPRVVFCAHIDTKKGTPGALDNATGIVVLMLLAELLSDYHEKLGVEIVALNGEDYYASPGQYKYLEQNNGALESVLLAINMDGAGCYNYNTAYSLFGCPESMIKQIKVFFSPQNGFVEAPRWHQSDHMIFVQNQRPAIAITSGNLPELSTHITHTQKDKPDLVDCRKLETIACCLNELMHSLNTDVT